MGLPRFELGSTTPEAARMTRLPYSPKSGRISKVNNINISLCICR